MSKISTYEVVPVPKLADKLIGTSVGGEIEDATYNFTLQELLDLFLPVIPANNLQGVLDYGNTATQDINLFGTITTTNLDVTDTANLYITYLNEETHIVGSVFDSEDSAGTEGQVLTSTEDGVAWVTLPPIFTPNLQQVLEVGNTSTTGIILDAGLEALDVNTDTATINTNITLDGTITDGNSAVGGVGQVLSSTGTGVEWVSLPVYTATSPLFLNPATNVISIQKATNTQNGYLSSSDWITFDGKQNAGNYITALTGEATASGPGAASVTLGNAAVIGKVLTGFNPTAGTINASDSILTAFGKTQSQINALVGGVQYKGTWNASTNVPTLQSSVGVQGNYYIVNVAGTTNLNGITDWQVGDWAIFSESTWQKVDNTESVVSVNGFTGAVSLTTDNIPEGTTNLYYLDSRARGALSFAAGSGAYNNVSGVITIPTDNSQILNGAGYITLGSLSANAPLTYNPLTGAFSIPKATTSVDGYLSATDWTTFNNKQNYLGGTGLVKSTAGTITYITDNSGNWNTAYDRSIVSAAVTGTTTKTLTLNEQDGNTITASWTDLDTGLTSVGVSMPSAFSVANSPLTANGTIAITGAGTSLQYIDGTGALQNFPGLTGFVPYTGATTNVNLGEFGISAGYFQADLTPTNTLQVGRMQWNATDGTMDLRLMGNNVTLQIGQETVTRVVNKSGIDLIEANYQVVRIRKVAEGGAQGQRLAVVLAQGNNENNSTEVLGLVTETILVNQEGFVTNFGEVKQINTTGSLQGETWVDGDVVYLSATTPGQLTNIRPIAPNHAVIVGYVTYAHAINGKIYVSVDTGYELGELHNVYAPSPADKASIWWNASTLRYENNTVAGILGYTPANAATELTINGTTYDLSGNRTWNVGTVTSVAALTLGTSGTDLNSSVANGSTTPVITLNVPTASAANRGALSAADWSTFNTKVGSVTASSPLASSGGSTPNITIQQASGSQNGYLSSTDWTTFNNKQAAGNYITSLTGEATASGPGAAAVTLNNASVTAKVLTGINITGGTVQATDTMLTAFGKLQNQINGLVGGSIYQGTWNASTNTPALASGVGTKGYYYIVSVAGNTNLDGITDWFVGDWAIFDGTAWQQVDNTDAVVSVNGQTGAVSLTTDNIPEGATNQYYLNSRARAALSFVAGSGAYNSTTGVITIPTNTNQLTNGASFITLASLSGSAPIQYNNSTGVISITQAGASSNGFLSSTDWNTFNNKQVAGNYVTTDTVQTISALKTFTAKVTINTGGTDDQLQLVGTAPSIRLTNAVTGATINGFIAMAGAANNYIQGAVAGDMCLGNQNNGKILFGFGSGTATQKMSLDSSGNVVFAGNITLSTSLSNGTYTYTLPGATGTLALTSQIPSLTGYVTGSGNNNYIAKFSSTGSTIANSLLQSTASNVFINQEGTSFGIDAQADTRIGFTKLGGSQPFVSYAADPFTIRSTTGTSIDPSNTFVTKFSMAINGDATFSNDLSITGTTRSLGILKVSGTTDPNATDAAYFWNATGVGPTISGLSFQVRVGSTQTTRLVVSQAGFLGVNTTTPQSNFVVSNDAGTQTVEINQLTTRARIFAYNRATTAPIPLSINDVGGAVLIGTIVDSGYTLSVEGSGRFSGYLQAFSRLGASDNNGLYLRGTGDATHKLYYSTTRPGVILEINNTFSIDYYNTGSPLTAYTFSTDGNFAAIGSITGRGAKPQFIADGGTSAGAEILLKTSLTTVASDRRNWSLVTEDQVAGDFAIKSSAVAGGTPIQTRLSILSNGYVGVNMTTPVYQFDITTANYKSFRIQSSDDALITIGSTVASSQFYSIGASSNTSGQGSNLFWIGRSTNNPSGALTKDFLVKSNGDVQIGYVNTLNDAMVLRWNGASSYGSIQTFSSSNLVLNPSGNNVGIGIINPQAKFVIQSAANYETSTLGSATANSYTLLSGNALYGMTMGVANSGNTWFQSQRIDGNTSAYNLLFNPSGGNVAIGTVTATALLTVAGTTDLAWSASTSKLQISRSGALARLQNYEGGGVANISLSWEGGNVLIGTSTDNGHKLRIQGNTFSSGYMYTASEGTGFAVDANTDAAQARVGLMKYGGFEGMLVSGNSTVIRLAHRTDSDYVLAGGSPSIRVDLLIGIGGAATFSSTVTATGFFESSDSRLKNLIKDDYKALGIESVKARLYFKNGKRELGYYAQDLENILPSAVDVNDEGFLNLSYTQVHTAKIAVIEDEVTILKKRVSELEAQLNLN